MERREERGAPKDSLEVSVKGVQAEGKIVMDLTEQLVGKDEASVLLVFSDRFQTTENFLNMTMLMSS